MFSLTHIKIGIFCNYFFVFLFILFLRNITFRKFLQAAGKDLLTPLLPAVWMIKAMEMGIADDGAASKWGGGEGGGGLCDRNYLWYSISKGGGDFATGMFSIQEIDENR